MGMTAEMRQPCVLLAGSMNESSNGPFVGEFPCSALLILLGQYHCLVDIDDGALRKNYSGLTDHQSRLETSDTL